jgi:hypothetical protein
MIWASLRWRPWPIGVGQSEGPRCEGIWRARPIVRPGVKPLWEHRSFPGLRHQALLYVASKVSASAIAAYTRCLAQRVVCPTPKVLGQGRQGGVLRDLIQDPVSELRRISILGRS